METRSLWVLLSDEQVEARSRQLARAHLDVLEGERSLQEFLSGMKETAKARGKVLDAKRGEVDALAEAVDNRRERTSVECDWRYNFAGEGAKYLLRRDTGEAVERATIGQRRSATMCSCCSDPEPAEDEEFYSAHWCGVCGHPGAAHARPAARYNAPCSAPALDPVQGNSVPAASPDGSEEGGAPVPAT